jgi:hypothetical protein
MGIPKAVEEKRRRRAAMTKLKRKLRRKGMIFGGEQARLARERSYLETERNRIARVRAEIAERQKAKQSKGFFRRLFNRVTSMITGRR